MLFYMVDGWLVAAKLRYASLPLEFEIRTVSSELREGGPSIPYVFDFMQVTSVFS